MKKPDQNRKLSAEDWFSVLAALFAIYILLKRPSVISGIGAAGAIIPVLAIFV